MRISKRLLALGAVLAMALGVAACGGGSSIPKGSVGVVAGNQITLAAFNHWEYVAAKNQAAQSGGGPVIVPNDPPKFAGCIKQVRQQVPSVKGTSDKVLKTDCEKVFQQYKNEVMGFLVDSYWFQAQAYKEGIHETQAQVQKAFDKIKKKNFSKKGSLQTYLKSTGETMADLLYQVRINELYTKLLKKREKKITSAAIASYYNSHKSQFGTKAYANLHLVRTKTQSQAQAAYNALKSGQSWDAVAKQYSIDKSAKANGGLLKNVTSGQEEAAVNKAIFSGKVNQIVGPIKGTFGWYVLEVLKVVPGKQNSLSQSKAQIKTLLTNQNQQQAASDLTKTAKASWHQQTLCDKTYSIPDCSNYVAPKTTTSTTTTPSSTATTGGSSTTKPSTSTGSSTTTTSSGSSTSTSSTSTSTTGTSTSKG